MTMSVSEPQLFIQSLVPGARKVQLLTGLFASVTIAQASLETGYGRSRPVDVVSGEDSYNLFGRKARPGEPSVRSLTWEVLDRLPNDYVRSEKQADGRYKVWVYAYFRKYN